MKFMVNAIMSSFIVNAIMVLLWAPWPWVLSWEHTKKVSLLSQCVYNEHCAMLITISFKFNRDYFCERNDDGCNLEVRRQTGVPTLNFITMVGCDVGKGRWRSKVRGESYPCARYLRWLWSNFQPGASFLPRVSKFCVCSRSLVRLSH